MAATFKQIKDRSCSLLYHCGAAAVFLLCVLVFSAFMLDILELYILESADKGNASKLPEALTIQTDERPIIGIVAQEYYKTSSQKSPDGSYIAASYVKMVESSGARVVPIFIGKHRQYYEDIIKKVNGILFPGGGTDLWAHGGYGDATNLLYHLALEVNLNETHFPVYGVCLGMESLAVSSANRNRHVLENVSGTENTALSLEFSPNYKKSGVFYSTPKQVIDLLKMKITANHHSKSVTHESFKRNGLVSTWRVLTTSGVKGGKRFISTMEHKQYPQIFGTQFHPEKPAFEWNEKNKDPHDQHAIIANRWFYDYFVQEARFNGHKFLNKQEERGSLIYNYAPVYLGTYFEQIYWFPDNMPAWSTPNEEAVLV